MIAVRLKIEGLVQGVGFRFFTKRLADRYKTLSGTVRNELDGSVVVEVVGPKEDVEDFVSKMKRSPAPSGHVEKMHRTDGIEPPRVQGFHVIGY